MLALTADDGTLAVLNQTDATVSVIDTSQLKVTATWSADSSAEKAAGFIPSLLSLAAPHSVVVGAGGPYVHLLDLATGSLSCTGVAGCDNTGIDLNPGLYVGSVASSPDGTRILFRGQNAIAVLDVTQNAVTTTPIIGGDTALAVNADNSVVADASNTYDGQLRPLTTFGGEDLYYSGGLPGATFGPAGIDVLNASGSLLFTPTFPSKDGVLVLDVHHGNVALRIASPDGGAVAALALDDTGTRVFSLGPSGLAVTDLYEAPLSIGSVTAGTGSSATSSGSAGATVTIRGSGFESGTTVSFGKAGATATFVDGMTLQAILPASLPSGPVQVTVTNPDGRAYSLDAAFTVN